MAYVAGASLLAGTAAGAAAALRLRSLVAFALAAYVLAWSELVLLAEGLSVFDAADRTGFLLAEATCALAVAAVWHRRGRPGPPRGGVELRGAVRRHPVVAGLALAVVLGGFYALFLGLATPPNNGDAMAYRLSRAVAWLRHGGIHWIPEAHTERQNEFPWVSEIPLLWTFALHDRDTFATLPQLAALAAVVLAVYGSAVRLGYPRGGSAFAALLTATLTLFALQSVQVQNDLLIASFVCAAAYFVRVAQPAELALAGAATGLALGAKFTAALALPTLALLAAVALPRRRVLFTAGAAACATALFAGPTLVANVAKTGSMYGRAAEQAVYRPDVTVGGTLGTLARAGYRFADLSGFRVRTTWLEPFESAAERTFEATGVDPAASESLGSPFTYTVNVVVHEDHSFFGPLGLLLVLPLSLGFAAAWAARRTTAPRAVHALALPLYVLLLALVLRFTDEARYLITPVALTTPLAATIYRHRLLAVSAAALGVATLFFTHAYNELKPTGLGGDTPVWELSRPAAQGIGTPGIGEMIAALEERVPPNARMGVVLAENARDYPLYGPRFDRELVPLDARDVLREADRERLDWIFLGIEQDVPTLDGRWTRETLARTATLLRRRPAGG